MNVPCRRRRRPKRAGWNSRGLDKTCSSPPIRNSETIWDRPSALAVVVAPESRGACERKRRAGSAVRGLSPGIAGNRAAYQVKAAFRGISRSSSNGVWGKDPLGNGLWINRVSGEFSGFRKFVAPQLERKPVKAYNVLILAGTTKPDKKIAEIPGSAAPGALTGGEGESFLHDGGMIALVIENRRVRFDVNLKAAVNSRLRLSSKLLKVARFVVK
jgi:hypothetical protein